jgi:MFS family permease
VFAVTLIGRPLGALIFGYFGDSLARRQTTLREFRKNRQFSTTTR